MTEPEISLREYIDIQIAHVRQIHSTERDLLREALRVRHEEMDRRLGLLNELRSEVLIDRAQFVPRAAFEDVQRRLESFVVRDYYEQQHRSLRDKVDLNTSAISDVAKDASNIRSRSSAYAAGLGAAISIMTIVLILVQAGKL